MSLSKSFLLLIILSLNLVVNSYSQISKEQAVDTVLTNLVAEDSLNYNVYLFPSLCTENEFNLSPYDSINNSYDTSFLFFIDLMPEYGWGHPCKYVFIQKSSGNYSVLSESLPPINYWENWEAISVPFPHQKVIQITDSIAQASYEFTPDPNKYALLITWNAWEDNARWNNLSHIYTGLKQTYGFMDENIFVLSGNGIFTSDSLNFDLDGKDTIIDFDGPCTKDSITDIFNYLANIMSEEDIFLFYATTHGDNDNGQDTTSLRLHNSEPLFDYELANMIDNLTYSQVIISIDACHAGGMVDNLEGDHRIIQVPVPWGSLTWRGWSYFDFFTYAWATAVRGFHPGSLTEPWNQGDTIGTHPDLSLIYSHWHMPDTLPDLVSFQGNGDGFIQFGEVFNYVKYLDSEADSLGIEYQNDGFRGDLLTLNGIEGRVDTSHSITGDFLIGRKLTLAPGVVLADSTTFLKPLNLFLNDSTEILVQDSATLDINGNFTRIAGCVGQSFVNIQGDISDDDMNFEANAGTTINVNFNNESRSYALESFDFINANVNAACDSLSFEKSKFDNSPLEFSGNYLLINNTNDFDSSELVLNQGCVTISQVNNFDYSDIEFSGSALNITGSNHINNSYLDLSNSDITIDDGNEFNNSSIYISHPVSQAVMAEILDNTFENDTSAVGNAVISLEEFPNFIIEGNDISYQRNHGIELYYAGDSLGEHLISENFISFDGNLGSGSELGIHSYLSFATIENNYISNNDYGIAGFHSSKLEILGDSTAEEYNSTQQIYDNYYSQCIFSLSSFPDEFRWNAIGDSTDSMDKPYIKTVKYEEIIYDTTGIDWSGDPEYDVSANCWSQGLDDDPEESLLPVGAYYWDSIWCPNSSYSHELNAAGIAYYDAVSEVENENYADAEEGFKGVIINFPGSKYSKASLKSLFALNPLVYSSSYSSFKNYCDSLSSNPGDSLLGVTAGWLSIHCNIKDGFYQQAVNSLDSIITNPPSLEDSIYALIDLGYVYTKIGDTTNQKSMLFSTHSDLIPKTYKKYVVQRDIWIEELLKSQQKEKNPPELFTEDTRKNITAEISSIYPNPASRSIDIDLEIIKTGTYHVMLYSLTGQKLIQYTESFSAPGTYSIRQDISMIPSGIYFLVIQNNGAILDSKKLVKSNE